MRCEWWPADSPDCRTGRTTTGGRWGGRRRATCGRLRGASGVGRNLYLPVQSGLVWDDLVSIPSTPASNRESLQCSTGMCDTVGVIRCRIDAPHDRNKHHDGRDRYWRENGRPHCSRGTRQGRSVHRRARQGSRPRRPDGDPDHRWCPIRPRSPALECPFRALQRADRPATACRTSDRTGRGQELDNSRSRY